MGGRGSGGRNRKNKVQKRVTGYAGKRTNRKKQRRERDADPLVEVSSGPLGLAPRHLTKEQKKVWYELSGILPAGVAEASDRWAFELLVCLMRKFRVGGAKAGEVTQISNLLARFGMTPVDRSRVQPRGLDPNQPPAPADPFAEFLRPATPRPI